MVARIKRLAAAHPEWWVLVLSAAAWFELLRNATPICCPVPVPSSGTLIGRLTPSLPALFDWFAMILAMMLPLMLVPLRFTAFASLWRRRHQAVAGFLFGYVGVWTAAAAILLLCITLLQQVPIAQRWVAASALLLAAAWQCTSLKRRFSVACHLTRPLTPAGWQANRDCILFGAEHARYCVGNCGVVMLAAMLSPFHRTMMLIVTLLLAYERYRARPHAREIPFSLCLLAAGHLV